MRAMSCSRVAGLPSLSVKNHGGVCECHTRQCPTTLCPFRRANSISSSAALNVNTLSAGCRASGFMQFSATMELKCFRTMGTTRFSHPADCHWFRLVPMRKCSPRTSFKPSWAWTAKAIAKKPVIQIFFMRIIVFRFDGPCVRSARLASFRYILS